MKNTYLPINWTDGVKLTKDHFINNYFNSVATVNDYTNVRLNNYNYGIVDEATDTSFEMETVYFVLKESDDAGIARKPIEEEEKAATSHFIF